MSSALRTRCVTLTCALAFLLVTLIRAPSMLPVSTVTTKPSVPAFLATLVIHIRRMTVVSTVFHQVIHSLLSSLSKLPILFFNGVFLTNRIFSINIVKFHLNFFYFTLLIFEATNAFCADNLIRYLIPVLHCVYSHILMCM